MIGKRLEPILLELEQLLWEFELRKIKPEFPPSSIRAATKIFSSVLTEAIFNLQEKENMPLESREKMAIAAGTKIRNLVKVYADIDIAKMYKTYTPQGYEQPTEK